MLRWGEGELLRWGKGAYVGIDSQGRVLTWGRVNTWGKHMGRGCSHGDMGSDITKREGAHREAGECLCKVRMEDLISVTKRKPGSCLCRCTGSAWCTVSQVPSWPLAL